MTTITTPSIASTAFRLGPVRVNLNAPSRKRACLMPGPLSGFRVIDLTQMISGPMATMILADQGADVVKVEPPGMGDQTRALAGRRHRMSPTFAVANRNKRSVVIDLKQVRGVELLKQLVSHADLFVQNFR